MFYDWTFDELIGDPILESRIFKRIAFKKGRVAAITATARKIAIIIWNMIIKNEPYSSHKLLMDNENYKKKRLRNIQRNIYSLNLSQAELRHLFERN